MNLSKVLWTHSSIGFQDASCFSSRDHFFEQKSAGKCYLSSPQFQDWTNLCQKKTFCILLLHPIQFEPQASLSTCTKCSFAPPPRFVSSFEKLGQSIGIVYKFQGFFDKFWEGNNFGNFGNKIFDYPQYLHHSELNVFLSSEEIYLIICRFPKNGEGANATAWTQSVLAQLYLLKSMYCRCYPNAIISVKFDVICFQQKSHLWNAYARVKEPFYLAFVLSSWKFYDFWSPKNPSSENSLAEK